MLKIKTCYFFYSSNIPFIEGVEILSSTYVTKFGYDSKTKKVILHMNEDRQVRVGVNIWNYIR